MIGNISQTHKDTDFFWRFLKLCFSKFVKPWRQKSDSSEELMPTLNRKKLKLRDRLRPRRIILVRHGESEGNKDSRAYEPWTFLKALVISFWNSWIFLGQIQKCVQLLFNILQNLYVQIYVQSIFQTWAFEWLWQWCPGAYPGQQDPTDASGATSGWSRWNSNSHAGGQWHGALLLFPLHEDGGPNHGLFYLFIFLGILLWINLRPFGVLSPWIQVDELARKKSIQLLWISSMRRLRLRPVQVGLKSVPAWKKPA